MGTNYYLHDKADCPACRRAHPARHIGKSSGGWCFALHVDPDDGIVCLDDWRRLWSEEGAVIRDEYGTTITPEEMEQTITGRRGSGDFEPLRRLYGTEQRFHETNQSERGPHGLLRHRIDGRHCLSHGEGTWDHIAGEFS